MSSDEIDCPTDKSLVKMANPILITNEADLEKLEKKKCKIAQQITADRTDTQEVLSCILPLVEWEENGQTWREQISSEPATRAEIIRLGEQLDRKLQQKQARETGICAIRRELFDQTFDEVARQVTVRCAERGLLLVRVRDELRMTLRTLQLLYQSSVEFGMKKACMGELGKLELTERIDAIKNEKARLLSELSTMKASHITMDKNFSSLKADAEKKHLHEMAMLMKKNADLKAQLEAIIMPGKSGH